MKKSTSLNLGGFICLVVAVYLLYCLLLRDNMMPFSIYSVFSSINHWAKDWHIIVIGLLPIYLALMIFGTAMFGVYLGSAIQRWISALSNKFVRK